MPCTKCYLSELRCSQVVPRGELPADILVVDEAPSAGDDILGRMWTAPHYRLFRLAFNSAYQFTDTSEIAPTYRAVYVVQCKPQESRGGKRRQPLLTEVELCADNLLQAFSETRPVLVLYLGNEVANLCRGRFACRSLVVPHPEYVHLRGGLASAEYRQLRSKLEEAISLVITERRK